MHPRLWQRFALYIVAWFLFISCNTERAPESIVDPGTSVNRVAVTPEADTILRGEASQLSAVVLSADGTPLQRPVTWASSNTAIATVSSSGRVTAVAAGSATIAATSEGKSGTSAILVRLPAPGPVAAVTVTPASASVEVGKTTQLRATVKDANGTVLTDRPVEWTSSNTAVATVSSSGLVTGVAAGSATITATSEGKSGSSSVTVTVAPVPVASVTVEPSSASIEEKKTVQLTATPRDAAGNALSGRTVTWASSNTAVATVSSNGLVTGVKAGSATITATSEGKDGTSAITVVAAPPPPPPPPGGSAVFVGAGDIGDCDRDGKEQTAKLLDVIAGTVYTTGDNAYPDGSDADFANCYDASWGRHKARTRPTPGNHDYHTSGAAGYYKYYGANAGPSGRGYFSYDVGEWHMISLNSNISMSAGSEQEKWLRADLAANPKKCTLAYWHHPRFSSGKHGNATSTQPLWQALYDADADVILVGHDHTYERFAPQTPTGTADPVRGIRQIVVGTGGRSFYSFGTPEPNSEVRDNVTWGVLKLTLYATSYDWEFVPVAGKTFKDTGTGTCH